MIDIRKSIDESYRRIQRLEYEIAVEQAIVRGLQQGCFHKAVSHGWCDDCDKIMAPPKTR